MGLRVGIIGGSITGCTLAIAANRAGLQPTVFERSPQALEDRGAGLGLPTATAITLHDNGFIPEQFPHVSIRAIAHSSRDGSAGEVPTWLEAVRWGHLYTHLRSLLPSGCYRGGMSVQQVDDRGKQVDLQLTDGTTESFDLVVFADGYQSFGRALISPDRPPRYQGYFIWRGLVAETQVETALFEQTLQRAGFPGGHFFAYLLPNADGADGPGTRELNWGMFLTLSEQDLQRVLLDRHGKQHQLTLPPGYIAPPIEQHLRSQAATLLPETLLRVVNATADTFGQGIVTTLPTRYHSGRLCLAGDAGAIVPPFTTSGVFKAMRNAVELIEAIKVGDTLSNSLNIWDNAQQQHARGLYQLSTLMEDRLIRNVPDFAQFSQADLTAWWDDIAQTLADVMG